MFPRDVVVHLEDHTFGVAFQGLDLVAMFQEPSFVGVVEIPNLLFHHLGGHLGIADQFLEVVIEFDSCAQKGDPELMNLLELRVTLIEKRLAIALALALALALAFFRIVGFR